MAKDRPETGAGLQLDEREREREKDSSSKNTFKLRHDSSIRLVLAASSGLVSLELVCVFDSRMHCTRVSGSR